MRSPGLGVSCTVRYPGPGESCTVRSPDQGSHAQWGILVWGVMHSEVSWYGGHAEWGVLVRGVMHSKVSWPGESCIVRYPDQGSHAKDPESYMSWLLDTI